MTIDLFTPVVPNDRLNLAFKGLAHRGFELARHILADIAATFNDKDGNFVKEFQTTGFDARHTPIVNCPGRTWLRLSPLWR